MKHLLITRLACQAPSQCFVHSGNRAPHFFAQDANTKLVADGIVADADSVGLLSIGLEAFARVPERLLAVSLRTYDAELFTRNSSIECEIFRSNHALARPGTVPPWRRPNT